MSFLCPHQRIPVLGVNVGDFWQWAYSDILSNRNRSLFAEYIVGVALGLVTKPRIEWASVDLIYDRFKIEVKSSAYWQSWEQKGHPSKIRFSIQKAIFFNNKTGDFEGEATRSAHAYVFCHYAELREDKVDVLDIPAWDFYVVPTERLNSDFAEAKSISLASVIALKCSSCKFGELRGKIDDVRHDHWLNAG